MRQWDFIFTIDNLFENICRQLLKEDPWYLYINFFRNLADFRLYATTHMPRRYLESD